jgi:predicted RecB family nuclease
MRGECQTCNWHDVCLDDLTRLDDPTLLRGVDDELRKALANDGIRTVSDVADLALDDSRMADRTAVVQARARTYGGLMRLGPEGVPIDLPRRRIEVDFDIETIGGVIYLAGLLVKEGDGEPRYEPIADWTGTPEGERQVLERLFERFARWSEDEVVVFHWTDYEPRMLTEAALRHGLAIDGTPSVDEWFTTHAFDLCAWSRTHLASPDGHSLKVIAPLCGFSWRDDDPGGLQSEMWFEDLQAGDIAMRQRLLAYNEDDVIAQAVIRRWVQAHDDGGGPGTSIPSVRTWPQLAVPREA